MAESFDWENPWRPNIEAKMAMAWGMAATATLIVGKYMPVPIPLKFSAMAALVCTGIRPVNLFIDEAAEVINQPTIQLMNKGGGALFRTTLAMQTFADLPARLGDENKARQVLGNINNMFIFRVTDGDTQKYITDSLPTFKYKTINLRYGHGADAHIQDEYKASYQESVTEEEADIITNAILGELPPLHFFAKVSGGRIIKGKIKILEDKD